MSDETEAQVGRDDGDKIAQGPACKLPDTRSRMDRRTFLFWAAGTSLGASVLFLNATLIQAMLPPGRSIDGMTKVGRVVVARLSDLEIGKPVLRDYGDEKILVVKTSHNEARAYDAACPHARCTLYYNAAVDRFDCPCHGSAFTMDGRRIKGPSPRDLVPANVEVVNDEVIVSGFLT